MNVLVYAFRLEAPEHARYAEWMNRLANGDEPFALSELVASGFVRVVTQQRIWRAPSTAKEALRFVEVLRNLENVRVVTHGPTSWDIFARLCEATSATGKLVADAYNAALAIEHGCELVTADGDFARFPGLRWRHPFAPTA